MRSIPRPAVAAVASAIVWAAVLLSQARAAQDPTPTPTPAMTRSTLAGVYGAAQAEKGQTMFGSICSSCHQPATHSGTAFKKRWVGHPLAELFEVIKDTMPDDNAGSLSEGETAQLVSYLLKLNGLPAGKEDLPADAAILKTIKIEVPATASRPGAAGRRQ